MVWCKIGNTITYCGHMYMLLYILCELLPHPPTPSQIWPHSEYPLIKVGKMVLNRNSKNYFAEVEQMSFEPSNMPPGIETSPDKMLQVCLCVCVYVFWWKGVLGEVAWYLPFTQTQHYRLHMISTIRTCARIYDFGSCTAKIRKRLSPAWQ